MGVESTVLDTGDRIDTLNDTSLALLSVFSSFKSFLSKLPLYQLIRLAWIIGGYILLRPYIELGLRKLFAGQEGHASDTVRAAGITPPPQELSASGIGDGIKTDGTNNEAAVGRTAWGAAARKRKVMIRQAWEEEQARLAEEHDLDGIDPDLLED
jgi:Protein trafficking PGA2